MARALARPDHLAGDGQGGVLRAAADADGRCPNLPDGHSGGRPLTLTPREFDLLECFMRHPRQVLTREAILDRVWGYDQMIETNVVDVYVRNVRNKLADGQRQRLQSVRGVGYVLQP
ncbi:MAG: winged helix-turn-helix domain-containing protein [Chloroflexota bacterium]